MLPEIMKNPTAEGGAQLLRRMGVDKSFISESYNRFAKYAGKVPGLSQGSIRPALDALQNAMGSQPEQTRNISSEQRMRFDREKYKRV